MKTILTLLVLLTSLCNGAIYEFFPGFENLYKKADFVGVITLGERDVPKDQYKRASDWVGPHRFFKISSVVSIKGKLKDGDVARLADRRLGTPPYGEILTTERRFLVFLSGDSKYKKSRYQWDEIHAEGSVLPVSPRSNFTRMDKSKPMAFIAQVITEYTLHCKELYEHAIKQQIKLKAANNAQQTIPDTPPAK